MLKERRENPEEPAEVKPVPVAAADRAPQPRPPIGFPARCLRPRLRAASGAGIAEPKLHRDRGKAAARAARPAVAASRLRRRRPPLPRAAGPARAAEPAQSAAAACSAAPPAGTVTASLPPSGGTRRRSPPGAATPLPPVTVNTTPADARGRTAAPQHRRQRLLGVLDHCRRRGQHHRQYRQLGDRPARQGDLGRRQAAQRQSRAGTGPCARKPLRRLRGRRGSGGGSNGRSAAAEFVAGAGRCDQSSHDLSWSAAGLVLGG